MDLLTLCIVFASGIGIGIFAVVFGGTLFLSLPLFQILFPELTLGAIIGNIKLGSVLRNAAALTKLRHLLDRRTLALAPILCLGSVLGSWQIANVSQAVVPAVLLLGWLVTEYSSRIRLPNGLFWLATFLIGLYGGIFGAGIMLLLLALLQLRQLDWSLPMLRANALRLELIISAVAVATFLKLELISWPLALTWAAGGMIGGFIGGWCIERTGTLPKHWQQWLVRIAFLLALGVALSQWF